MRRSGLLLSLVLLVILAGFVFLVQRGGSSVATTSGGSLASGSGDIQQAAEEPTQPPSDDTAPTPTPVFSDAPLSPLPTPTLIPDLSGRLAQYSFTPSENRFAAEKLDGNVWIGDWLPDNRTISIVRYLDDPKHEAFEEIAALDTESGGVETYGIRRNMFILRMPDWLEEAKMMSFVGAVEPPAGPEDRNPPLHLWITQAGTTVLENPLVKDVVASTGRGHTVIAMQREPRQLIEVDALTGNSRVLPADVSMFRGGESDGYLQMLWHPILPLVAIFDDQRLGILDLETQGFEQMGFTVHEDAGIGTSFEWVQEAYWNQEEPLLAIRAVVGHSMSEFWPQLMLLDVEKQTLATPHISDGWVTEVAWTPNAKDLLIFTAQGIYPEIGEPRSYVLDTETGALFDLGTKGPTKSDTILDASWTADGRSLIVQANWLWQTYSTELPEDGSQ